MSAIDLFVEFIARAMLMRSFDQDRRLMSCGYHRRLALRSNARRTAEKQVEEFVSTMFTTDNRDEDIERIVEQFDGLQQMRSEVNERTRQRILKEVHTELKEISKEKHHHHHRQTNRFFETILTEGK